ncbi:hypothetical protein KDV38_19000 [Providencia rettgeri]
MFDGLGYVIAVAVLVLLILCITYLISIGNAFSDTALENEASEYNSEKTLANDNERNHLKNKAYKWRFLIVVSILVPILNFIYYCEVEISFVREKGEIFFGIFTFFIFTVLNFFLVILKFKKSSEFVGAFLISFIAYNAIYFPQKLNVDFVNKAQSLIANGDTKSLRKLIGENCEGVDYNLDNYIWYASFSSKAPAETLEFLFGCQFRKDNFDVNKVDEGSQYLFDFFIEKVSINIAMNQNVELLFAQKYFPLLDEKSKKRSIESLVSGIAYKSNDIYINRLDALLNFNPDIANYVSLRDDDCHEIVKYKEVNSANYFLKKFPPNNDDCKLAMNILTNNLPFVIEKVKSDSAILGKTFINNISLSFYKYKKINIDLIFYAFYVGNAEMINYLIDNELFKLENYNYEVKTNTQDHKTGEIDIDNENCNNYLVTAITENRVLSEDEKRTFLQKLKSLPNSTLKCDTTDSKAKLGLNKNNRGESNRFIFHQHSNIYIANLSLTSHSYELMTM